MHVISNRSAIQKIIKKKKKTEQNKSSSVAGRSSNVTCFCLFLFVCLLRLVVALVICTGRKGEER